MVRIVLMSLTMLSIAAMTLFLAGCGPDMIALRDPATKQVVECKGDPLAVWIPAAAAERCAEGYEKAGFKRITSD